MFRMMAKRLCDAPPYLGIGVYYFRPDTEENPSERSWLDVTLEAPLILNAKQVRMLIQKYGTDSGDDVTTMAGAWTLRREILHMGYDGIIAVDAELNDGRLMIVDLARAVPGSVQTITGYDEGRVRAQIHRIVHTELPQAH
jgi:hypothetical protein